LIRRWGNCLALVGLVVLFALLTLGERQVSVTADEPTYIACGYAFLSQGKGVFPILTQRSYPPLLITLEALPVYLADPTIPIDRLPGWPADYADFLEAFKPYLAPIPWAKTAARIPTMMLTVLMGAVVYRWGKDMWGRRAGLLALAVFIFDPLILAHGRIANSDVGSVAVGTAALYAVWRWTQGPSWRRAVGAGALLGLTMLGKASGVIWTAAAGVIVLATIVVQWRAGRFAASLAQGAAIGGLGLLVLWAGYGFDLGPLGEAGLPVPAPAYWASLFYLSEFTDWYFAMGQWSFTGWWWYFPLAFLIKNPFPLLIGLAVGLGVLLRRHLSLSRLLALGLFPVLYSAIAIFNGLYVGYRYMVTIHPLLHLIVGGGLAHILWGRPRSSWWRWVAAAFGVWYALGTVAVFPWEIAYFNELVGGARGGYRYLSDSNIDWGQADGVLAEYVEAHPDVRTEPPALDLRPEPGRYVVGASYLQGVGIGNHDAYEWFRHREPEMMLAYSLLVYEVDAFDLAWVAQCETLAPPLDDAAVVERMGGRGARSVGFNCTEAWLYPTGGDEAGIYSLHHDLIAASRPCLPSLLPCPAAPSDPFVARHVSRARLSYEQREDRVLPAFALYELGEVQVTPASSAPVALDGPLSYLWAAPYWDGESLEVETWWRVVDAPITRPFSIMAHLRSPDGQTLEVADGLSVSPVALAVGDVVVQRHQFSVQPEAGSRLLTGAYWLDTMERWPMLDDPDTDVISIQVMD
jgi:hypothetical protein